MNTCKNCNNCAWYCHADGKCYGGNDDGIPVYAHVNAHNRNCHYWTFDGLEDWEREELNAPVEMVA